MQVVQVEDSQFDSSFWLPAKPARHTSVHKVLIANAHEMHFGQHFPFGKEDQHSGRNTREMRRQVAYL